MFELMSLNAFFLYFILRPMFGQIERGPAVADPESHTLHLLREFRQEFKEFRKDFTDFRASTEERFDELARTFRRRKRAWTLCRR
jgi:hypothetical protein